MCFSDEVKLHMKLHLTNYITYIKYNESKPLKPKYFDIKKHLII